MFNSIKRAFNAIGAWILNVFAAIMRVSFPQLCCKYFTKIKEGCRDQEHYAKLKLFLPGEAKELRAIKKLKLSWDEISDHVWSPETELALLKEGNYALIGKIRGGDTEALDVICATGDADLIAKVFAQATPSNYYLKKWLFEAKADVVAGVLKRVPVAFNSLSYDDVNNLNYVGVLVNSASEENASDKQKKSAQKWATEVVTRNEFMNCSLSNQESELFESAMSVLLNADYDFSKYMENLQRWHRRWYCSIRDHASTSAYCEEYLIERLPRIWYLADAKEERFAQYSGQNCVTEKGDARRWMTLVRKNIWRPRVAIAALRTCTYLSYNNPGAAVVDLQRELVSSAQQFNVIEIALGKLPEQYQSQLQSKLYGSITTVAEAMKALELLPASYHKGIRAKIAEIAIEYDAEKLLSYWPFDGWEGSVAASVVRKLSIYKWLPLDKLTELPKHLQNVALEELEIQAELGVIHSFTSAEMEKLIEKKLHSRSEVTLLTARNETVSTYGEKYVSLHKMSDRTFSAIVLRTLDAHRDSIESTLKKVISLHAEKWGLSEENYKALLQSPYSSLAALLKESIRKAQDGEPKSSGAVMPNKHGFVAIEET